jgi:hypothetical protein
MWASDAEPPETTIGMGYGDRETTGAAQVQRRSRRQPLWAKALAKNDLLRQWDR